MKNIILKAFILFCLFAMFTSVAFAAPSAKVMVIDFPLNDLTDLPNPPEEIARISYFNNIQDIPNFITIREAHLSIIYQVIA